MCWAAWGWSRERAGRYSACLADLWYVRAISVFCLIFALKLIKVVLKRTITCSRSPPWPHPIPHSCPSSYPDMIIGGWLGKAEVVAVSVGTEGACCANEWLLVSSSSAKGVLDEQMTWQFVLCCLRYAWWSGAMFHTKSSILENIVKPNCSLPTQTSGACTTKLDLR